MRIRFLVCCMVILAAASANAQLFRAPASGMNRTLVRASRSELSALPIVKESVAKKLYAAARDKFRQENDLLSTAPLGLVQVKLPNSSKVTGTGFLFEAEGHLFVGMAYHVGGKVGSIRTVRVFSDSSVPQEYSVTVNANGSSGWHTTDISIAEIPMDALKNGARPLALGTPRVGASTFSLGYTSGRFKQQEFLPVRGKMLSVEGYNMEAMRELIPGENVDQPFLFSGYCGSPLLQLQAGQWKVVGVCAGGHVASGDPTGNRTFAVNLSRAVPQLIDTYLHDKPLPSRGLYFRGWLVERLAWTELISDVEVWRGENKVFEQNLHHYPGPYSDEHSELAVRDFDLQSDDVVRYVIRVHRGKTRTVEFKIP